MGNLERFIPKSKKGKAAMAGLGAFLVGGLLNKEESPQSEPIEQSASDSDTNSDTSAQQPEHRRSRGRTVHAGMEEPEDTGEVEEHNPLGDIDFHSRYLLDFPEKNVVIHNERPTLQFPVKQMDSTDKRIYDRMQDDGDFALAYQDIANSLEWAYDGEYGYVTSTNTDLPFDMSFNLGNAEPYAEQRLIVSYEGTDDRNHPVKDDVEDQVYELIKIYLETAAKAQVRGE